MAVNDDLFDALVRHQIGLNRLASGNANALIGRLNRFDRRIAESILSLDAHSSATKVNRVLKEIREVNAEAYQSVKRLMTTAMKDLAASELDYQFNALKRSTPAAAFKQMRVREPSKAQARKMVTERAINGYTLEEYVAGMESGRYQRIRAEVRKQVAIGGTDSAVSAGLRQAVLGSAAAKYQDGVLGLSRRSMEQVTRTVSTGIASSSRDEFYQQNDDIFDGVQWVAMLETNTCEECAALDGTIFAVDEGPRPPVHINCRCEVVPVVKDWEAMGLSDLGPGTRESMDGEVPETRTYNDWLRGQSAAVQDEILGPSRGVLYRKYELPVDRFVDRTGRRWTLDELERQGLLI